MKAVAAIGISMVLLCSSCSGQNTADIPGPWKLHKVALMDMAPAGDGKMTVALFSTNKKPRYLWMTMSFEKEPDNWVLERFAVLNPDGRSYDMSVHSSIVKGSNLILIFESQTGWDKSTKLVLSGMDHRVPFKTPRKVDK